MMKTLENIPLSSFVRYGVTGIICAILFLVLPLAIYAPSLLGSIISIDGILGVVIGGFTIGFVIDGLKLYQFSPRYSRRKTKFMKEIAKVLEVDEKEAVTYFIRASQIERDYGKGQIDFVHSRWVMFDTCSKLFFISGLLWSVLGIIDYKKGFTNDGYKLILAGGLCIIIAIRWIITSSQEQGRSEALYINFCKRNKNIILGSDRVFNNEQINGIF